ncbi:shikimate dehydrogenase [uncultured Paludibaculum sp.]|uniref:shikimate dehydrogenase n=1 Tax=uncultured Paludibaculum sp. TaxID=1765020 RepID=UPI002AAB1249|nr:shikimate dehydrogenase [uncultured Paludibaculum sp.]
MPSPSTLPRICIALGLADPEKLLEHARKEADAGERFLEFRLDYLARPQDGMAVIRKFLQLYPDAFLLATCRRHQNHGRFNGSIEEEFQILAAAVDAGARAVDVEIESAETPMAHMSLLEGRAQVIVSYHNFEGTPAMDPIMRRMLKVPAAAYKIVTTARKPSDNLRVLALAKAYPKIPVILLAMSETGFPTRVLSPVMGGVYTYAAPSAVEGTAAGQVSAKTLRNLYRVDKALKAPKLFGVIADPVRHSISPAVHNRALQARRVAGLYLPFLVSPLQLKDFFVLAEKLPLTGFSVTIPHKQRVIRYLDAVDPLSKRIGAINTVYKKAGKWRGTNTDAEGIRVPLEKRIRVAKSSVLVVGNGGTARSAAFTLSDAGAKLAITGRNPDRVRALAKICDAEPLLPEQAKQRHFDALIHATPLGMWPHTDACFFEDTIPANLVFDLVYTPHETELLRRAAAQGRAVIHGLEMFLEQAARQFTLFTGESAPKAVMERAAIEALAEQQALTNHQNHKVAH